MSVAFFGTWNLRSDPPATAIQIAEARKFVGQLQEYASYNQLGVVSNQKNMPDGTVITVLITDGMPIVNIQGPGLPLVPALPPTTALWVPRGFVVIPASFAASRGVGVPIQPIGNAPYTKANLDPGVDFDRWTPGGYFGQVLLSRDTDAGYSQDIKAQAVPMYYGVRGPSSNEPAGYDYRTDPGKWGAYRVRFSDFIQHYAADPTGARRGLFAAVNTYRINNSAAPAYLWPVGFYRPAEALSYLIASNGIDQTQFPPGYQTTDERLLKDGQWAYVPNAYGELVSTTGGTSAQIVDGWAQAHSAILLLAPTNKAPVFADVGVEASASTLVTQAREQWIMAGRRAFHSQDYQLPPISWDAPPSLNLGWLTFPIVHAYENIYTPVSVVDDKGAFYQKYYTSDHGSQPGIGPYVYCRGRQLGAMPNGGLVLGAGIVPLALVDRLVVIAYHPSENTGLAPATQGLMAACHVWYHDFPSGVDLRLHAEAPITEWQDGGKKTLPGMKYDSFWSFHPSGMKAVCLRDEADIGVLSAALQQPNVSGFFLGKLVASSWSGAFAGVVCEMTQILTTIPTFNVASSPVGSLPYAQLGDPLIGKFTSTVFPPRVDGIPTDAWGYEEQLVPHAAGYVNGAIQLSYTEASHVLLNRTDPRAGAGVVLDDLTSLNLVAFGPPGIKYASEATSVVIVAKGPLGNDTDKHASPAGPAPSFVDLPSQTFALDLTTAAQSITSFTVNPDDARYYDVTAVNVPGATTEFMNSTLPQRRVRMFQRGLQLNESTFAHPYGVPWAYYQMALLRQVGGLTYTAPMVNGNSDPQNCDPSPVDPAYVLRFDLPKNIYLQASTHIFVSVIDQTMQAFYATRFEEEITGYQIGLCAPTSTMNFKGMKNPVLQDRAAAFASNVFDVIPELGRTVTGGWYKVTFNAPAFGAGWLAQAVIV